LPPHTDAPPCPKCLAADTERLPFAANAQMLPVYTCNECGHVWQVTPPSDHPRKTTGKRR